MLLLKTYKDWQSADGMSPLNCGNDDWYYGINRANSAEPVRLKVSSAGQQLKTEVLAVH